MVSLGLAGMSQPLAGMPVELAYANKQMAVRAGAQTWSCRSVQAPSTSSGVPAGTVHFQAPVNLGVETLNGVAVWHVRDTGTAVLEQKPQTITVDLYIAQASHSLLRLVNTSNGSVGKNAIAETSSVDFSKYGEAVSVTLPVACRSSGSAGLTSQLVQKMSLLLNPRALLRHLRRPVH
jgi:hypothetical protein